MKKLLIGLVITVVVVFGGLKLYRVMNYGGTSYYTRITTDGQKVTQRADDGVVWRDYRYVQAGYDENGKAKQLNFTGNKTRPLRRGAYLKVVYNQKKGVTGWTAVPASEVPAKALTQLK
ncbi:YxeA family protein [Lacticaseibacillus daqingensis]|uniref:YxeA family protein n=1 Tax=Lacticaseibacillus daqingensis TaxID=2486014 RepID=UPI000F768010|nr:YxeA family protein [Lacticaseibacillus daqingensis]